MIENALDAEANTIHVDLDPFLVDANIHPRKAKVRSAQGQGQLRSSEPGSSHGHLTLSRAVGVGHAWLAILLRIR